jgi:uncharacterized membrane protein
LENRNSRGQGPLFALLAIAMVLLASAAPALTVDHPVASLVIRSFFSRLCHQDPGRTFILNGSPIAICVRCFGIYSGTAMGALLGSQLRFRRVMGVRVFLLAAALNVIDVASEAVRWHGNLPLLRLGMGTLVGLTLGILLGLPDVNREVEKSATFPAHH